MSGQKASKQKSKKAPASKTAKKTAVSRAGVVKRGSSSRAEKEYHSEQNKSTGKIEGFVVAMIALIIIGVVVISKINTAKEINDNLKTVAETGKSLEESSKAKAAEVQTSQGEEQQQTVDVEAYKKLLNEYMDFMESYVAFMKKYKNASSAEMLSMMNDYTDILNKQMEWGKKLEEYDGKLKGELSEEDYAEFLKAYADVINRAAQMMQGLN